MNNIKQRIVARLKKGALRKDDLLNTYSNCRSHAVSAISEMAKDGIIELSAEGKTEYCSLPRANQLLRRRWV